MDDEFQKQFQYPCQYCGECSIWLSAFETTDLDTLDKVIDACLKKRCSILGKYVQKEDILDKQQREQYNKLFREPEKKGINNDL